MKTEPIEAERGMAHGSFHSVHSFLQASLRFDRQLCTEALYEDCFITYTVPRRGAIFL
ncbi:hypothetical protein [Parabacteroides sp. An277]|uniref:hypothetical protein n=1 Tax=Parabacteroides sp. An277 TaxID=1965619 RepID=UPI0013A61548|nr:hypothetical protein [Parabacteroides sp. An277]